MGSVVPLEKRTSYAGLMKTLPIEIEESSQFRLSQRSAAYAFAADLFCDNFVSTYIGLCAIIFSVYFAYCKNFYCNLHFLLKICRFFCYNNKV